MGYSCSEPIPLKPIAVIQDEITEKIVIDLDVKLVGGEQSRVYRKSLKNHKAREVYYHGLSNVHRLTKESVAEARRSFKKVIELEPDSPLGYAWAGATHFFDAYNGWSKSFVLSLQSATELAQKAIALDDSTADAHTLLGFIYVLTRQFDKAISEAERALALCPNGADIVQSVAGIFMFAGKPKKAVALTKQAMRLNPIPPPVYFNFLGISYREIKEYEAAIATLKEGIARYPEYILSRFALVTTYCAAGRYDEAQVEVRELLRIDPRFNMEQYTMMLPYKDKSVIERLLADLREAGLLSTDLEP